jgi:hypothetical protein
VAAHRVRTTNVLEGVIQKRRSGRQCPISNWSANLGKTTLNLRCRQESNRACANDKSRMWLAEGASESASANSRIAFDFMIN